MNSRQKGKVGEREFAALLRAHGFDARRGQQFSGGAESPDVVSQVLSWLHVEVKRVQNLNLTEACAQAERDQTGSGLHAADAAMPKKLAWVVAHRRNHAPWLITMRAETFFRLLRGELPPGASRTGQEGTDGTQGTNGQEGQSQISRLEISEAVRSGGPGGLTPMRPTGTILGELPKRTGGSPVPATSEQTEQAEQ